VRPKTIRSSLEQMILVSRKPHPSVVFGGRSYLIMKPAALGRSMPWSSRSFIVILPTRVIARLPTLSYRKTVSLSSVMTRVLSEKSMCSFLQHLPNP